MPPLVFCYLKRESVVAVVTCRSPAALRFRTALWHRSALWRSSTMLHATAHPGAAASTTGRPTL